MKEVNYKKIKLIINIIGILIIIFSIFYFIESDLTLSGQLELKSDFSQKNPMFSVLFPEQRTQKINNGFKIIESPVYFDLRSPIKFNKANIKINFDNFDNQTINLGIRTSKDAWTFENYPLINENSIIIDLTNAKIEYGNIKFMLSIDNLDKTKQAIIIKSIDAKLYLDKKRTRTEAYKEFMKTILDNIYQPILKTKNNLSTPKF